MTALRELMCVDHPGVVRVGGVVGHGGDPRIVDTTTISAVVDGTPAPFLLAGPLGPVISGLLDRDPARRPSVREARTALARIGAR